MKSKITQISLTMLVVSMLLAACGNIASVASAPSAPTLPSSAVLPQQSQPQQITNPEATTSLSAYETTLEEIYTQVNPAVVSIRVVQRQDFSGSSLNGQNFPFNIPGFPNFFNSPNQNNNQPPAQQFSQALGSGFVWNQDGYIVTNNHVVSGANKIEVKFADGTTLPATLIGADPDSDLAVIKVSNPGFTLTSVTVNSSTRVKVGQIAVAIGNPYGLENSMTVGIVSALGRTLPAGEGNSNGATFSIPDIIQTDAPINPGNSGGPLVDDHGALIGVNSAIESQGGSNSGIGFAIPATIVSQVIPELIKNGKYEHPYLGISGTTLTPDLAKAMNLDATQRGALVEDITSGTPADKAGLHGSDRQTTIDGQNVQIGGDLIIAIDGTPVKTMDDLIAYLADHTNVGQKVTLTILRDGKEQSVDVTLQARPAQAPTAQTSNNNASSGAWLGIAGQPLTADINKEMNLPNGQSGILVEQVQAGSPADKAGLQGSFKPVLINGQRVLVGGDVITAIDGNPTKTFNDLQAYVQNAKPGQDVKLTILRDGKEQTLTAALAEHP
jgi:serine protease Do